MARGDADAIAIALRNLIENAILHGGGGPIRVEVRQPATVIVTNSGAGVSADSLQRLRERTPAQAVGVRGSGACFGAGLGLSIVALLVDRLQATLTLASPAPNQLHGFEAVLALQAVDSPANVEAVSPMADALIASIGE
jgi:two-component system, OmpR family, sensor kinase